MLMERIEPVTRPEPGASSRGDAAYQRLLEEIHRRLLERVDLAALEKLPPERVRVELRTLVLQLLGEKSAAINPAERQRIVALARTPMSATEMASRLGLPRQRVNYHVRQLERARFLERADQRVRPAYHPG